MTSPMLLMDAALNALLGIVYFAVGRTISQRKVSDDATLAKRSFSLFWYALSGLSVAGALANIPSAYGLWGVDGLVVYTQVLLATILVALAALLYYFVYLLTGKHGAWRPIAGFYMAYYIAILYYIAAADPVGVEEGAFGSTLAYANDYSQHPATTVLGLLLLVPTIIGAIGYFSLFRKVDDPSGRFRIAMIAGAIIVWFGASLLLGQLVDTSGDPGWRLVSTGLALLASAAVYYAFRPTTWMRKRFGLHGYGESV